MMANRLLLLTLDKKGGSENISFIFFVEKSEQPQQIPNEIKTYCEFMCE